MLLWKKINDLCNDLLCLYLILSFCLIELWTFLGFLADRQTLTSEKEP